MGVESPQNVKVPMNFHKVPLEGAHEPAVGPESPPASLPDPAKQTLKTVERLSAFLPILCSQVVTVTVNSGRVPFSLMLCINALQSLQYEFGSIN